MANGYKSALIASLRGNTPAAPVMGSGPTMGVGPTALNYGWMQNPNTTPINFTPPERVRLNRPERIQSQGMTNDQVNAERMREIYGDNFGHLNGVFGNMQDAISRMARDAGGNIVNPYVSSPPPPPPPPPPAVNVTRRVETITPEDFAALSTVADTVVVPEDVAPVSQTDMYEPGFDLDSLRLFQVDVPQLAAPILEPTPVAEPVVPQGPTPEELAAEQRAAEQAALDAELALMRQMEARTRAAEERQALMPVRGGRRVML